MRTAITRDMHMQEQRPEQTGYQDIGASSTNMLWTRPIIEALRDWSARLFDII
jgi:hypothetical protein